MKKINLLLALLFCGTVLCAQTDFRQGYVIKTVNDTVWGEIDYRGDKMMGEVCTFRKDKNAEVTTFAPADILGFRFIDSKYFISKEVNGKKVFLEFLINGKVNIYYLRDEAGEHYYIDKEGEKLTEIPYEEGERYKDNMSYLYQSKVHVGILSYYMQDAQDFIPMINEIKKPDHKSLVTIAEKYHNKVCDGTKCIIYEKKMPVRVDVELAGGITHITKDVTNDLGLPYPTVMPLSGVLAHIWLPRSNENLYLKTGLLFMADKTLNSPLHLFAIPIQIEYLYPRGIIRPRISVGFNNIASKPVCSYGANIVLSKSMSLSVNCDLSGLLYYIYSASLYAGLRFKL